MSPVPLYYCVPQRPQDALTPRERAPPTLIIRVLFVKSRSAFARSLRDSDPRRYRMYMWRIHWEQAPGWLMVNRVQWQSAWLIGQLFHGYVCTCLVIWCGLVVVVICGGWYRELVDFERNWWIRFPQLMPKGLSFNNFILIKFLLQSIILLLKCGK